MKKIISSSIILVAGAVMMVSTAGAQGLTIEKRHYNKGFYVDFGKKKTDAKHVAVVKNDISAIETSANNTLSLTPVQDEQLQMVPVKNVDIKRERVIKKHTSAIAAKAVKQNMASEAIESTHSEVVKADDSGTAAASTESSSNHAGVSLLLLVIITILIPPLGVALAKGIGTQFWIDLILTILFVLPGIIYGLIVVLGND